MLEISTTKCLPGWNTMFLGQKNGNLQVSRNGCCNWWTSSCRAWSVGPWNPAWLTRNDSWWLGKPWKSCRKRQHQDFFKTDSGDGSSGKQWFWDTILIWLVVWLPFFIFPLILGISSSQLTFIFFRGVAKNHQPVIHFKVTPVCLDHPVFECPLDPSPHDDDTMDQVSQGPKGNTDRVGVHPNSDCFEAFLATSPNPQHPVSMVISCFDSNH